MPYTTISYQPDSANLFAHIAHLDWAIFFDSCYPHSRLGRFDIMSALPSATVSISHPQAADPFQQLRELLAQQPPVDNSLEIELPFTGGLLGYAAYDINQCLQSISPYAKDLQHFPLLAFGLYDWAIVVDHQQRQSFIVQTLADHQQLKEIQRLITNTPSSALNNFHLADKLHSSLSDKAYATRFQRIQDYIHAGDCYQVNFTQAFHAPYQGHMWPAYLQLRQANPAPFSCYFNLPQGQILSLSPERFLTVNNRHVKTSPIKGTIKRSPCPITDEQLAAQLLNSEKDRAENVMIVDLMRNDLSQVCRPGSVQVPKLFDLLPYPSVHHLESHVVGELADEFDVIDLFKACLPGGSITGAPKIRAMQIIRELEPTPRQAYCGAFAYIDRQQRMDSNIAIRTIMAQAQQLACHSGGGIVADSSCQEEYDEVRHKISRIMACLHGYT